MGYETTADSGMTNAPTPVEGIGAFPVSRETSIHSIAFKSTDAVPTGDRAETEVRLVLPHGGASHAFSRDKQQATGTTRYTRAGASQLGPRPRPPLHAQANAARTEP